MSLGEAGTSRGREGQRGAILPLVAVGLASLFAVASLALDAGGMITLKERMQVAANAGALAGAMEASRGNNDLVETQARAATAANGFTHLADSVTVTINSPSSGACDNAKAGSEYVEVLISKPYQYAWLNTSGTIRACATANLGSVAGGAGGGSGPVCLVALSALGTDILSSGGAKIYANNCDIWVNSAANSAMKTEPSGTIEATQGGNILIVGGYDEFKWGNPIKPTPETGQAQIALGSDDMPDTPGLDDHCNPSPSPPNWGTATFNPGSYCGKLRLDGSLMATFKAGTYVFWGGLDFGGNVDITFQHNTEIITVGGGLSIGNSAKVKGTGVSFYNTCRKQAGNGASTCPITGPVPTACPTEKQGKQTINLCGSFKAFSFSGGDRTISLAAPASGAFRNILLYSDVPGYVNTIEGSAQLNGDGIICLPSQDLSVSGGAALLLDGAVTANRISAVGSGRLTVSKSNSVADANGQPCLLSAQKVERIYLQ